MAEAQNEKIVTINRKARHEYTVLGTYEAGIVLTGTEVKSIRQGKMNLVDAYAMIKDGEVWLFNAHISEYDQGNINNHDPIRTRKLLLNRNEIRKLINKTKEKGLTLIPLRVYFLNGKVKVEIGLAQGKKSYDKREDIAKRDLQREQERRIKF